MSLDPCKALASTLLLETLCTVGCATDQCFIACGLVSQRMQLQTCCITRSGFYTSKGVT